MSPKSPRQITELIHHPYQAPDGFTAVPTAIYKASTVIFPTVHAMQTRNWRMGNNYSYGLHGTPTTFTLQERLATLEGGLYCLLAPSGLAAIGLVNLALLNQGDEVLIPQNSYGPTIDMVKQVLGRFGVGLRMYDPLLPEQLAALIQANTRLIWLEAAGSVTMEFPDLSALIKVARNHQVLTVLDNTWGAGIAFNAFDLPEGQSVDLTMHALTKYPSGGADVLMGSILTRNEGIYNSSKRHSSFWALMLRRMMRKQCCAAYRPSLCAIARKIWPHGHWQLGWRLGQRLRRCCILHYLMRTVMRHGEQFVVLMRPRQAVAMQPVFLVSSFSPNTRLSRYMVSVRAYTCLSWAIAGVGR